MSDPRTPLIINTVALRRSPGLRGELLLNDLSSGINVIFGPNASGKSSLATRLARTMQQRANLPDAQIEIEFTLDADSWQLNRDGTRVQVSRNGIAEKADPAFLHSPDDRLVDRYLLAIHDLLRADDSGYSEFIAREAVGGYDIAAATNQSARTRKEAALSGQPRTFATQVAQTQAALRRAQALQESLQDDEARLTELQDGIRRAQSAIASKQHLDAIENALDGQSRLADAQVAVNRFVPAVVQTLPEDGETIESLTRDLLAQETEERTIRNRIGQLQGQISGSGIEPGEATRLRLEQLKAADAKVEQNARRLDDARTNLQTGSTDFARLTNELGMSLTPDSDPAQARALLSELAANMEEYSASKQELDTANNIAIWLNADSPHQQREGLGSAIQTLQTWLQTPRPEDQPRSQTTAVLLLGAFGVAAAIALGLLGETFYAVAAILPVVFMAWWFYERNRHVAANPARRIADGYPTHVIEGPAEWTEPAVRAQLDRLNTMQAEDELARQQAQRWAGLNERRTAAEAALQANLQHLNDLRLKSGLQNEINEHLVDLVRDDLTRWSDEREKVERFRTVLNTAQTEFDKSLVDFNEILRPLHPERVTTALQAHATLSSVSRAVESADAWTTEIRQEETRLAQVVTPRQADLRFQLDAIHARIETLDPLEVRDLVTLHAQYRLAVAELDNAISTTNDRTRRLPDGCDLSEWSLDRVAVERETATVEAEQLEHRIRSMHDINQRVQDAKHASDVSKAFSEYERALQQLEQRRDDIARDEIGSWLATSLMQDANTANLPVVANIARDRFSAFTDGQFSLQFELGSAPTFRARNEATGNVVELDQLSSSTRVQLLMAVRTAFVESRETSTAFPLLLDETLANADERRADAIIQAMIEIAQTGRQIFYFTAQDDEVARWERIAREHNEVPIHVCELTPDRQRVTRSVEQASERTIRALPDPSLSREEYRRELPVPVLDPWMIGTRGVHLWYLEHELQRLNGMLQRNLNEWGPVAGLLERDLGPTYGISAEQQEKLAARAELCEELLQLYRIGRARRVTSDDLAKSGAISATMMTPVAAVLENANGDGADFLEQLGRAGTGLSRVKREQLEIWLTGNGLVRSGEPWATNEIRQRLRLNLADSLRDGRLTDDDIEIMLTDVLGAGVAGG